MKVLIRGEPRPFRNISIRVGLSTIPSARLTLPYDPTIRYKDDVRIYDNDRFMAFKGRIERIELRRSAKDMTTTVTAYASVYQLKKSLFTGGLSGRLVDIVDMLLQGTGIMNEVTNTTWVNLRYTEPTDKYTVLADAFALAKTAFYYYPLKNSIREVGVDYGDNMNFTAYSWETRVQIRGVLNTKIVNIVKVTNQKEG